MKEYRIVESFSFIIGYFFVSLIFMFLNGYELSIWLGINVALAVVPFILIQYLHIQLTKDEFAFKWRSWILLFLFIIFLPNTFYIITDMIHINSDDFYHVIAYGDYSYRDHIEPYMLIVHIFISVVVGVYLGVRCLIMIDEIMSIKIKDKYTRQVYFVALLVLSSIGIYIGRFLRFFSWDIFNPLKVIPMLLDEVSLFMFTFIITFTIVQYLLYYAYKLVFEKEPFK